MKKDAELEYDCFATPLLGREGNLMYEYDIACEVILLPPCYLPTKKRKKKKKENLNLLKFLKIQLLISRKHRRQEHVNYILGKQLAKFTPWKTLLLQKTMFHSEINGKKIWKGKLSVKRTLK